jgi:hypothetical protein
MQEEIFGRITKNLKWLEILLGFALEALKRKEKEKRQDTDDVCELLLERIRSAERSVSVAFVPILTSLYPHKYEIGEMFSKYASASYEIAKGTGNLALVTEELWQETLPDYGLCEYSDSERRITEIVIPRKDETCCDSSFLARHAYVAGRNLCTNIEQLGSTFNEQSYVASFVLLLSNRILQMEDALLSLHKLLIKTPETKQSAPIEKPERKARSMDVLLALKTGRALPPEKKFSWDGKIFLSHPEVTVSADMRVQH